MRSLSSVATTPWPAERSARAAWCARSASTTRWPTRRCKEPGARHLRGNGRRSAWADGRRRSLAESAHGEDPADRLSGPSGSSLRSCWSAVPFSSVARSEAPGDRGRRVRRLLSSSQPRRVGRSLRQRRPQQPRAQIP